MLILMVQFIFRRATSFASQPELLKSSIYQYKMITSSFSCWRWTSLSLASISSFLNSSWCCISIFIVWIIESHQFISLQIVNFYLVLTLSFPFSCFDFEFSQFKFILQLSPFFFSLNYSKSSILSRYKMITIAFSWARWASISSLSSSSLFTSRSC